MTSGISATKKIKQVARGQQEMTFELIMQKKPTLEKSGGRKF